MRRRRPDGRTPPRARSSAGAPAPPLRQRGRGDHQGPPGREWQCATLHVPLDYTKPRGATIGIALIRAKATDPKKRIGSLIFNFGGPGGSGVATLPALGQLQTTAHPLRPGQLRSARGRPQQGGAPFWRPAARRLLRGRRLPGRLRRGEVPGAPRQGLCRRVREAVRGGAPVRRHHQRRARHGADAPRPRRPQAVYFGVSYGTELGGVYAHLYPKKVGRALFDGVVDPAQNPEQGALGQAKGSNWRWVTT